MDEQSASNAMQSPDDSSTVLDPGRYRPRGFPVWTTVVVVAILGLLISVGLGILQETDVADRVRHSIGLSEKEQSVVLLESRDDLLVISVKHERHQEVRIIDVKSGLVEDVSRGAQQATQPELSHSGELIAYFTLRNGGLDLDVSEVGGTSRTLIPSTELSALAKQKNLKELHVCPWTRLSWSQEDRYLAFFSCVGEESLITVKDRTTGEFLALDSTQVANQDPRTLAWLSDTELAVVQPEEGFDTVWIVNVASQQRQQLFGP